MAERLTRHVPLITLLATGLLMAGCSKAAAPKSDSAKTTSGATTAGSSASVSGSATPSTSASASPSPTATVKPNLGGTCDDLLPVTVVDTAIGLPVIGKTAFIVGIPEPKIGRLVYLNCRYGIAAPAKGKPAVPKLEIGLSLYDTPGQAERRVQGTIEDFRSHAAVPKDAAVGQFPATILTGYGDPTLVVSAGPRTVAITISAKMVGSRRDAALMALAKAALDATAKFNQGGGPATSPTPSTSTS